MLHNNGCSATGACAPGPDDEEEEITVQIVMDKVTQEQVFL